MSTLHSENGFQLFECLPLWPFIFSGAAPTADKQRAQGPKGQQRRLAREQAGLADEGGQLARPQAAPQSPPRLVPHTGGWAKEFANKHRLRELERLASSCNQEL